MVQSGATEDLSNLSFKMKEKEAFVQIIANWRCLQIDPHALFYFIPLFGDNKS